MALIIDMLSLSIEVIREKKKVYYGEIEEKENIIFTFNNKVILFLLYKTKSMKKIHN